MPDLQRHQVLINGRRTEVVEAWQHELVTRNLEQSWSNCSRACARLQGERDALAARVAELEQSGWISTEDRLPEKSGVYPACSINNNRRMPEDWIDALCAYDAEAKPGESRWQHSSGLYDNGITHWMPLPTAPAQGTQQ